MFALPTTTALTHAPATIDAVQLYMLPMTSDAAFAAYFAAAVAAAACFILYRLKSPARQASDVTSDPAVSGTASAKAAAGKAVDSYGDASQKQLEDLQAEMLIVSKLNGAKSRLLVNMCHEMRTPLTGLVSVIDLLVETKQTEQQRRLFEIMQRSANALVDVVNALQNIPLIEAGEVELSVGPFDLVECVEQAASTLVPFAKAQNVGLSLLVSNDLPALVEGDKARLNQILGNLIGRAIKGTKTGQISISATIIDRSTDALRVRFLVQDTGQPLDTSLLQKLRNVRNDSDYAEYLEHGIEGTALFATSRLIEQLGGSMALDNIEPNGVAVTFDLPFTAKQDSMTRSPLMATPTRPIRALIVSPSEDERQILGGYLGAAGCSIEAAASVWEAQELVSEAGQSNRPFQLLILDSHLSKKREGHLAANIRNAFALNTMGIVMVVDIESRLDLLAAEAMGQWEFVTRPVARNELFKAAEAQLEFQGIEFNSAGASHLPAYLAPLDSHVLVVEDNLINQEVMREYLTEFGCTFHIASDGEEGVRAFKEARFDIVLMDIQMPVMDGLTATKEIRAFEQQHGRARTPIVAVSAHAFERERVKCMGAQMDDFLSKPYTQEQLHSRMCKAMNLSFMAESA